MIMYHNSNVHICLFLFPFRGHAKAGESVLVHGASGGVSILRRQVVENAVFCPSICFCLIYGHICINKWINKIVFSSGHFRIFFFLKQKPCYP